MAFLAMYIAATNTVVAACWYDFYPKILDF